MSPSPENDVSTTGVMNEVRRVLAEHPQAAASFGDAEQQRAVVDQVERLNRNFSNAGGVYFEAGGNAFETAERFARIHVDQYRETGRPSLPALAIHHAEQLGLDRNSPEYKAMILVATRAEAKLSATPDYHSQFHYTDVAAMTANLVEKNNAMVQAGDAGATALSRREQALTFIAAIGHDLDHDGRGNPPDNPLHNEQKSFRLMEPLLREAGLPDADVAKVHTILMTTSPNGPHAVLKEAAAAQREGRAPDFSKADPKGQFTDISSNLMQNRNLTQMSAMVSDADLYPSSGAGEKVNQVMSRLLTAEVNKAGVNMDFTTDGARKFFLDNIVGKEGFASNAGREVANESFMALRTETEARIVAAKPPTPPEPPAAKPPEGSAAKAPSSEAPHAAPSAAKPPPAAAAPGPQADSPSSASKFASVPPRPEAPKARPPAAKPEPPKAAAPRGPQASVKAQTNAGRAAGAADAVVAAASGDYGRAATSTAMSVGLDQGTYKAASTLTSSVKPIAAAIGQIGKRVPLVGGLVTLGYVAYEAGGHALDGNFGKAAAATVAGAGEIGGNLVGFGVGDAARQGIVEATKATVGEKYAPRDAGLVTIAKEAVDLVTRDPPKAPPRRPPSKGPGQ